MRNFKKFLAVIVVVTMILSTMMVSVFADDSAANTTDNSTTTVDNSAGNNNSSDETPVVEKTAGEICADLGILKGGDKGVDDAYLALSTQRIQAAIIYVRLLGLEEEAKSFDGTENFDDASKVADASAVKLMAYLKANPDLGWVGDGKNFNPTEQISAQQFYKVLLTTLGYAQGEDFEYSETIAFAKFVGLSKIAQVEELINANMAVALVEALGCTFKGGSPTDTLISKLVNDGLVDPAKAIADGFDISVNEVVSVEAPAAKDVVFGTVAPELPASVKGKLTDGSSVDCDVTWDLAGSKYDGNKVGKYTISGTVEGFADGVTMDVNVKALVLDVVSVDVLNLRQLAITFNGAVSGDAVKNAANYTVKGVAPVAASLSDDGKVVTLTTSIANKMVNYSTDNKLVIKKDIGNGLAADKTVENIIARDTTVPTMLSVTATGPRTIKAVFSEPVSGTSIASAFSLNDGKIGLDVSAASVSANTTDTEITIKTLADLQEGAQTLKVSGSYLTDAAGYAVAGNSLSFNYAKDSAPLTVAVKSSNETSVTVKFNKDIVGLTDANFQFSHTYKGYAASTVLGNSGAVTGSGSEWTISFAGKPFPPGATTLYISYVSSTGTKIKDGWGNEMAETTLAITTSADTAAPTATAEFVDQNKIKVTFSEDVDATTAKDKANYSLKSGSDVITINDANFDTNSTKVIILTTNTINGGSLTLTIKNVKDTSIAGNKMADATLTIAASDKVAPDFAATKVEKISSKKIKVNFNEAMDVATITDKNMYVVSGTAIEIDTITAVNSNKSAVITFKADIAGTPTVLVGKVKDVAGNYMALLQNNAGEIPATLSTIAFTVEATGANKVKLTIADTLSSVGTIADYVYSVDGTNWSNVSGIASFTVDTANNKSYIELTLGYTIADTNTAVTAPQIVVATTGSSVGAKNGLDQALAGSATATDKLAPKLMTVTTGALDLATGTKLKTVIVTFSEALYVPSVSDSDFTVDGFTVSSVAVAGNVVTITLADKDNSSTEKPKVTLTGSVEDANRNALTGPVEKTM